MKTDAKSQKSGIRLKPDELKKIHELMVQGRLLEERLIRMFKSNDGYFWIGGPGEEAFNIPLGMLTKKGKGKDYDYLHLHYRSSGILVAMGADPKDAIRQMKNTATDPYSGGRNFGNHYSKREWNVVPVSSTIGTQYASAIGTGIAQARHGGDGITIVNGGDAGTAEGEFASCLVWASRRERPLPILIVVTNNHWGISTPEGEVRTDRPISDRGIGFGIRSKTIDGNDPEEAYLALKEAMDYIRKERKPYLLEAKVSRLYGHSSASGANPKEELDCLRQFEDRLKEIKVLDQKSIQAIHDKYHEKFKADLQAVKQEPMPDPSTIFDYTYYGQKGKYF